MKPGTKLQRRVVELSENKLPKITDKQKAYGLKHNLDHRAVRLKSGKISCLDCGHSWQSGYKVGWHDVIMKNQCPNCKVKLKIEATQKKISTDWSYLRIITTCEEFQVIRLLKVSGYYFSGKKARLYVTPMSEIWMSPKGKFEIVGFNCVTGYQGGNGYWNGDWSLKSRAHLRSHNEQAWRTYPIKKVTKEIRRNGFKNSFHNCKPYTFFRCILDFPKYETLLKAKQYSLLEYMIKKYDATKVLSEYWKHIKMCMRNGYIVKDASIWFDYLNMCEYFNIDTLKAEVCCNPNVKLEHNRLMQKKQIIEGEKKRLRDIANHEAALKRKKDQKAFFEKNKRRFSNLIFRDKDIVIKPFQSVAQLKKESSEEELFHCAYIQKYHLKLNSLLLSAHYKGKPMETIQICLKTFQLLQARGYDNDPSKHNKRIVKLVEKNLHQIKNIVKPLKARKPRGEMVA